ncbi:predicted protein [Naegleria gruberi]|uniref:Predicted protein n=1 Tax=Naegleria gruberi TaxID=5762 RepID=D2VR27_NAEGR|nr:uncharacterized protein NAEGRDRAFT_71437 [Naegleria gruberi]EFC40736.1 predicted protein [Naegleria gruberi]|eukprot:XP_002673480.1 predicted protein [Naegleria gruberi strain NEG-M]
MEEKKVINSITISSSDASNEEFLDYKNPHESNSVGGHNESGNNVRNTNNTVGAPSHIGGGSSTISSGQQSSALTGNNKFITLRETLFQFLISLNVKTPKVNSKRGAFINFLLYSYLLYITVIISSSPSLISQDPTTSTSSSLNSSNSMLWGGIPGWIWRVLFYPINLGAEHYPYEAIVSLLAIFVAIEGMALFFFYLFKVFVDRGSKVVPRMRIALRIFSMVVLFLSPFIVWIHSIPMAIYSSNGSLTHFPTIQYNSPMNIAAIVIGCVGIVLTIIITLIGSYIVVETIPPSLRYIFFAAERVYPLTALFIFNQLSVLLTVICDVNYVIVGSSLKIVLSLLLIGIFANRLPFFKRFENSILIGILCARVVGSIGPIVSHSILVNSSGLSSQLVETIGGSVTGGTLVLMIGFFILSTTIFQIYLILMTRGVKKSLRELFNNRKTSKTESIKYYMNCEETHTLKKLLTFMKFSLNSFEEKEDSDFEICNNLVQSCMNTKVAIDVEYLILSGMYFGFFGDADANLTNSVISIGIMTRGLKHQPNIIQKFHIILRTREIESIASQSNAFNLELKQQMSSLDKKQVLIMYFHREFFKELLSDKPHIVKLENINRTVTKMVNDCDNRYRNLAAMHRNNKTLLRSYAVYLETLRFEKEAAQELYEEANTLEEEEVKRGRRPTHKTSRFFVPQKGGSRNRVFPVTTTSEMRRDFTPANDDVQEMVIVDEENWDSVSAMQDEGTKKEIVYRMALNSPDDNKNYTIWFALFCFFTVIVFVTCLATSLSINDETSKRVSLQETVCSLSSIPSLMAQQMRAILAKFNHASHPEDLVELEIIKSVSRKQIEYLISKVQLVQYASTSGAFIEQVVKTYTDQSWDYYIPTKQFDELADPLYDIGNSSVGQFVDMIIDSGSDIIDGMEDLTTFNKTLSNYPFLLIFLNRKHLTEAFDSFCVTFIEGSKYSSQQGSIIFHSVCCGVLGLYLVFTSIYLFVLRTELLQLHRIFNKVFTKVPKDETGKIFHSFDKKVEDEIRKENRTIFTPQAMFLSFTIATIVVVVIVTILVIVEFNINARSAESTMLATNSMNTVVLSSMVVNFNLLEMILESHLYPIPQETIKKINIEQLAIANFAWRAISVGSESNNYKSSIYGVYEEIDQLLKGSCVNATGSPERLTNTTEMMAVLDCMGMEDLVDMFVSHATEFNQDFAVSLNEPETEVENYFSHIYYVSIYLSQKLFEFIKTFVSHSKNASIVITYASCFGGLGIVLVLFYFSYTFLQNFWDEKHHARTMLNYVKWNILEQNRELNQFVISHEIGGFTYSTVEKIANKVKKGMSSEEEEAEDPMSMTISILNATTDGSVICNHEGAIQVFNNAAEDMFGCRKSQVVGLDISNLFSMEDQPRVLKFITLMNSSSNVGGEVLEIDCQRRNQTIFPAKVTLCVSYYNKKPIFSCFIRDVTMEKKQNALIQEEKKKSEELLLNILPKPVAHRLMEGERNISEKFGDVSVFFSDMVGFTKFSSQMEASDLVTMLNQIVEGFDSLTDRHGLDKIKTIGDAFFAVGGLYASKSSDHPERALKFSIDVFGFLNQFNKNEKRNINIRIGLHTGPCGK